MAFPTVRTRTETAPASSTSLTIDFNQQTGDLVVIFLAFNDTDRTLSTVGDGFTNLTNTSATFHILYKVLDGSEGGNVVVTIAVASKAAAIAYNITSGTHASATAPVFSTVATGTSTGPDPGSLSPAGGSKDYLWIAAFRQNGEEADDDTWCNNGPTTPGTFTNLVQKTTGISGATTTNGSVASAEYTAATATVDPGAFNTDQGLAWRAYTLAIYPDQSPKTISPSSISSAEAFGTAIVKFPQTVSLSSISSAEVFGTVTLPIPIVLSPFSISSPSDNLSYESTVLADSPIAYWRLGEASDNPQDSSGNAHHVNVVYGTPTYGQTGALTGNSDNCIWFDADFDYMSVPDHAALDLGDGPWSVECFAKRTAVTGQQFAYAIAKNSQFCIGFHDDYWSVDNDSAYIAESVNAITDQAWHHYVVTRSAGNTIIYVDGSASTRELDTASSFASNATELVLGAYNSGNSALEGYLDEVAIYNYVLTASQVRQHYEKSTSAYQAAILDNGPLHYWRLGEPSGTTAIDQVGTQDGTYVNGPTLGYGGGLTDDPDKAIWIDRATSEYVQLKNGKLLAGLAASTVEMWVLCPNASHNDFYVERSGTDITALYKLETRTDGLLFVWQSDNALGYTNIEGTAPDLDNGLWHHIAVTVDGTAVRLYCDGVDIGGGSLPENAAAPFAGADIETWLGADKYDGPSAGSYALFDEVAVYSATLTPDLVTYHYEIGRKKFRGTRLSYAQQIRPGSGYVESDQYKDQILKDGPTAYWRLGELSGYPQDSSGNAHHITTVGGTPDYSRAGVLSGNPDTAILLDAASGEHLSLAHHADFAFNDVLTFEWWMKRTTVNNGTKLQLFDHGSGGSGGPDFAINGAGWQNRLTFEGYSTSDVCYLSTRAITDTNWHHFVFTRNGTGATAAKLYIDGVEDTLTDPLGYANQSFGAGSGSFNIGSTVTPSQFLNATLDEIAVYDYPLTAAQAAKHFALGSPYKSVVLQDTPIAYWRLGEKSGTVAQEEIANKDAVYVGNSSLGQAGGIVGDPDASVLLNGITDYVRGPASGDLGLTSPISLEAWINLKQYPGDTTLVGQWNGTAGTMLYITDASGGTVFLYVNGSSMSGGGFSTNAWHHVVGTYDGTNGRIYVDGVLISGPTALTGPITVATVYVEMGTYNDASGGKLNGQLDEVAIYDYALTPTQVQEHYLAGLWSNTATFIGDLTLTSGEGLPIIAPPSINSAEAFGTPVLKPTSVIAPTAIKSAEVVNSAYSSVILRDIPIAYWRLGEASGNPQDSSGNGHHVTSIGGSPDYAQSGAIAGDANTAIGFVDSSSEYLSIPYASPLGLGNGPFTLEAWVKPVAAYDAYATIVAMFGSYMMRLASGGSTWGLELVHSQAQIIVTSTTTLSAGQYHHVVATKTGSTSKLYVDGVDVTGAVTDSTIDNPATAVFIGTEASTGGYGSATIDEAALYSVALSPTQVAEHYLAGISGIVVSGGGATSNVIYPSAISSGETFGTATILRGTVSVLPSSINSVEAFGTAVLKPTSVLTPTAIGTTETFGTPVIVRGGVTISVTTITSAEALGTSTILRGGVQIQVTGIGSQETLGSVTLIKIAVIIPTAISSSQAFGTASVGRGEVRVIVSGIASSEVIPSPVVKATNLLSITGITTGEVSGTSTIIRGIAFIVVSGIVSTETVGTPLLPAGLLFFLPGEIVSSETFGVPLLRPGSVQILVSGIGSGQALGSPVLSATARIVPSAITSGETVSTGTSLVAGGVTIQVSSITTGEAFGNPTLITGAGLIVPIAITTGEAFGSQTVLRGGVTIIVSAVGTGEALGSPIIRSAASIIVSSVTSLQAFGTPTLLPSSIIQVGSIGSAEAFGNPVIPAPLSAILVAGIGSAEAFGTHLVLTGGMAVQPVGIPTAQALGLPTLTGTAWVLPEGIAPAEALGWPVLVPGMVWIYPGGIPSLAQVGTPAWLNALISRKWVNPSPVYANTKPGGFPEIQTDYGHTQRDEGED